MVFLDRIERFVSAPSLALRLLNRLYHTRFHSRSYNTEGVDIFEEDWDNLIILDATRFSLFEERVDVSNYSSFESRISRGSNSYEFVLGNFFDRDLEDVAYLTGNPHILWMQEELDKEVKLYALEKFELGENSSDYGTHTPEEVRKQTEQLIHKYDDKRMVVHFMQPHYPFLDSTSQFPAKIDDFWYKAYSGQVEGSYEDFWKAYSKNFDRAWKETKKLLEDLEGKTVVTADHGNVFGERVSPIPMKEWGHPQGIYDEKLVKVPWLVIEGDERRDIVKGEPKEKEDYDEEEIKSQLADLGYGE